MFISNLMFPIVLNGRSFETAISDRLPMAVVLDANPVSDIMNMSNMSTLKMAYKMVWSSPMRGLFTMLEVERHDAPFASPIFCIKISCCDWPASGSTTAPSVVLPAFIATVRLSGCCLRLKINLSSRMAIKRGRANRNKITTPLLT